MKNIITTTIFVCGLLTTQMNALQAQTDYDACLSLSIGSASPLGDFGDTDINNDAAGGVDGGTSLEGALSYDITETFGLKLSVFSQFNSLNQDYMVETVKKLPGYTMTYTGYGLFGYMIGGYYSQNIGKLKIRPKLSVGYVDAKSPELKYSFLGQRVLEQAPVETGAFAAQLGVDVSVDLGKFRLFTQFDYLTAAPTFEAEVKNVATNTVAETNTWKQSMQTTNFRVGIGYLLNLEEY